MFKIRLVLLTLISLLVPSVAMAADGSSTTDATRVAGVAAIVVAVALAVTRFARILEPLHGWLPARAQWVPAALVAAAGILMARLPAAQDWVAFAEVVVEAAVVIALAAAAGVQAPAATTAQSATTKAGLTSLVLLALLFGGCAPSLAASSAQSPDTVAAAADADASDHCRRLSNTEDALRYVSVGAAVLGGGTGLSTVPVEDDRAETALAVTAGGFAVVGATSEAIRAEVASSYIRDCE